MDDASVAVSVFGLLCQPNGFIKITASNKRNEWHHLFGVNKWMIRGSFTEQKFNLRIDLPSGRRGQLDRILAQ